MWIIYQHMWEPWETNYFFYSRSKRAKLCVDSDSLGPERTRLHAVPPHISNNVLAFRAQVFVFVFALCNCICLCICIIVFFFVLKVDRACFSCVPSHISNHLLALLAIRLIMKSLFICHPILLQIFKVGGSILLIVEYFQNTLIVCIDMFYHNSFIQGGF